MPMVAGQRLGPYEVQSLLGAGGMGEVYKARDTRLDRTVALKILPPDIASDPDRRARFEREAHAIAALSHPHICTLHDIGTESGTTFLVMEHLAGETLAARLARGPLPLAQVLDVGAQVAEGLAAAHKAGIVHRDLKPANVMLVRGPTASGPPVVKLLDFGLAKLTAHGEAPAAMLATTMALPASLTGRGTIVGTLPYMAPEQVQGHDADARTDLWALGTILYEMLTGTRAFEASSAVSLIGAILEREPAPLSARQPLTSPSLDRTVRRCLAKHPDDRWDSAHDVAAELQWIAETLTQTSLVEGRASWRRTARRVVLPTVIGVLIGGMVGGLAVWSVRPRPALPVPVVRTQLDVQPADDVYGGGVVLPFLWMRGGSRTALAWTPNGRTLVFVGRHNGVRQLYVRDLDHAEARPLAGTDEAQLPAVSPDGQSVVFWAKGAILRAPLDGGVVQTLAGADEPPAGLTVGSTGRVVFSSLNDGRIWQVTSGSAPIPLTTLRKGETAHLLPHLLPTDAVLLYTVRTSWWTWGHERVVAQVLITGERKTLVEDAADARYVPTGHLVFLRRGLLMAVPFDLARLTVTGAPVAMLDGIAQALTNGNAADITGAGQFSVSAAGALAFVPSPVVGYPDAVLATVDRQGRVSVLPGEAHSYLPAVHLSPDGHRLAVSIQTLMEQALWVADLTRGSLTKLTVGGEAEWPRWSPDGQHIAFDTGDRVGEVVWQPADGSAPSATLASGFFAPSWSPDGQHVAVQKDGDIWVVTVGRGQPTLTRITETPEEESSPEFSPDGHWMAYTSNKTGRPEVYVKPVSASAPVTLVSFARGSSVAWNPRGSELFFFEHNDATKRNRLMAVAIRDGRISSPVPLFDVPPDLLFSCVPSRCYDVTPDGLHFVVTKVLPRDPPPPVTHINLVLNWVEELKAKIPVK